MSYKSPISIMDNTYDSITDAIEEQARRVAEGMDDLVIKACIKVGCTVDKDELEKALRYDRGQYDKGYADGKRDAAPRWVRLIGPFDVIDRKTGKYPDLEQIALNEDWAKRLIYCDMEGFAMLEDGNLILLDECGNYEYCPPYRFEAIISTEPPREGE